MSVLGSEGCASETGRPAPDGGGDGEAARASAAGDVPARGGRGGPEHWLMAREGADTPAPVWAGMARWIDRKAATFQPRHVAAAWQRLRERAWA